MSVPQDEGSQAGWTGSFSCSWQAACRSPVPQVDRGAGGVQFRRLSVQESVTLELVIGWHSDRYVSTYGILPSGRLPALGPSDQCLEDPVDADVPCCCRADL